jgi:RNA-directed DNA polymerase
VRTERTDERRLASWADIDWLTTEEHVRRLQGRIFRAAAAGRKARVKNLQKLLVRSGCAKLLAIRQVTQQNAGRNTPGVDGVVCNTPQARVQLFNTGLNLQGYRPQPVRRVFIPKSNGKERPLGIPTIRDRVMQAIVKMALEPEWENRFEANSYGFRPGRCTMDAIAAIHRNLNGRGTSEWILDADISGCFDNIDHESLLARLPVFTAVVRRWLKAGVIELGAAKATHAGTPQGGIISPLLANVALDGMERLLGAQSANGQQLSPASRCGMNRGVSIVRYADDFVVTAPARDVLESHVLPVVASFLAERGLKLNEAKTQIVHVDDGFNFLGFNIRRFGKKVLTKPQKEKVLLHLRDIRDFLIRNRQRQTSIVISELSPVIRGWSGYYRYGASKQALQYADYRLWLMLWCWALRRHRNKRKKWVKSHYFKRVGQRDWVLSGRRVDTGKEVSLCSHSEISVKRFVKVKGRATPMNPDEADYWEKRKRERMADAAYSKRRKHLLERQGGACGICHIQFDPDHMHFIDVHHDHPLAAGGSDQPNNLMAVHRWCHHSHHMRSGYKRGMRLEPDEGRLSSPVLRGAPDSNVGRLPDKQGREV